MSWFTKVANGAVDGANLAMCQAAKVAVCGVGTACGAVQTAGGVAGMVVSGGESTYAQELFRSGSQQISHNAGAVVRDITRAGSLVVAGAGAVLAAPEVGAATLVGVGVLGAAGGLNKIRSKNYDSMEEIDSSIGHRQISPPLELKLWHLAEISNDVYYTTEEVNPRSMADVPYTRIPGTYQDMVVYKHNTLPHVVIAFKGSDNLNLWDLYRDWGSIINDYYPRDQIDRVAHLVQTYEDQQYQIGVTGHSFGGYLAEIVATTFGLCGAGFCAPGPGWHLGKFNTLRQLPCYRTINEESDVVGNIMARSHHCGDDIVYIEDGLDNTDVRQWMPIYVQKHHHSIENMANYMRVRHDWTSINLSDKLKEEPSKLMFYSFPGKRSNRRPTTK